MDISLKKFAGASSCEETAVHRGQERRATFVALNPTDGRKLFLNYPNFL